MSVRVRMAAAVDAARSALPRHEHHGPHHHASPGFGILDGAIQATTLASCAFMAGLAVFAALVWSPAAREDPETADAAAGLFARLTGVLLVLLAVAGAVAVALYAARASGEPPGPGLLAEAWLDTRVGRTWLARLGLALLVAACAAAATRWRRRAPWWAAAGSGGGVLLTLTSTSHAAADGRFLPFVADWSHLVAGSVWAGGLLGFCALMLGPLRAANGKTREVLIPASVRRFSNVAAASVLVLLATGLYASLLHVPDPAALVGTPYGRALLVKLGLLSLLVPFGLANLTLGGRGPFGRLVGAELALVFGVFAATGFLSTIPPP